MSKVDVQFERINQILGVNSDEDIESLDFEQSRERFFEYLKKNLKLPCKVTGSEDFRWEEYYVIGPGNAKEYERLKKFQPSYRDRYDLLAIDKDAYSEWMLFHGDDIGARVRREKDGKEFWLGLGELKGIVKKSPAAQLLDDFAVWLCNYR